MIPPQKSYIYYSLNLPNFANTDHIFSREVLSMNSKVYEPPN